MEYNQTITQNKINKLSEESKKIILLNTPIHGNLGDHAIKMSELNFIKANFPDVNLYEFNSFEYDNFKKQINDAAKNALILIHGGGYIGTLWRNEEKRFEDILKRFSKNKIIVFPQTVFFSKTIYGYVVKRRLKELMNNNDVLLCLRDKRSYDFAREKIKINVEKLYLIPDMVIYNNLYKSNHTKNREGVLFCIRKDKESKTPTHLIDKIFECCSLLTNNIEFTDTVIDKNIFTNEESACELEKKLSQFSKYKLIVTDRIHGMLFSALTNTPCIALDNISKKVSGQYEWISHLKYIKYINNDVNMKTIEDLYNYQGNGWSNNETKGHYSLLKKAIEKGINKD